MQAIRTGRYYCLLSVIFLMAACSSLPEKQSAIVDKYRFSYAVQGSGTPTVVFESGFGSDMDTWSRVFPEVATVTTAFAYNRRGYRGSGDKNKVTENPVADDIAKSVGELVLDAVAPGVSSAVSVATTVADVSRSKTEKPEQNARTAKVIIMELRALLRQIAIEPPYILVGHSLGGLYAWYFAQTWPEEVRGLVLVDSSHPEQMAQCRERFGEKKCQPPAVIKTVMKLLPDEVSAELAGIDESGRQVNKTDRSLSIPVVILSHVRQEKKDNPMEKLWPELQQDLVSRFPRSRHIIATESGHFIQNDRPELVIQAIIDLVDALRKHNGSEAY